MGSAGRFKRLFGALKNLRQKKWTRGFGVRTRALEALVKAVKALETVFEKFLRLYAVPFGSWASRSVWLGFGWIWHVTGDCKRFPAGPCYRSYIII